MGKRFEIGFGSPNLGLKSNSYTIYSEKLLFACNTGTKNKGYNKFGGESGWKIWENGFKIDFVRPHVSFVRPHKPLKDRFKGLRKKLSKYQCDRTNSLCGRTNQKKQTERQCGRTKYLCGRTYKNQTCYTNPCAPAQFICAAAPMPLFTKF